MIQSRMTSLNTAIVIALASMAASAQQAPDQPAATPAGLYVTVSQSAIYIIQDDKQLDVKVGKNKDKKMAAFVVFLTDDPDAMETKLEAFAKKHKIKNVPLTIIEGKAGPRTYKVAKDAEVTVMMWKGQKVRVNHAFRKGELNTKAVKKIVTDTKIVLAEKSDKK